MLAPKKNMPFPNESALRATHWEMAEGKGCKLKRIDARYLELPWIGR
jgi:hypothetical protein